MHNYTMIVLLKSINPNSTRQPKHEKINKTTQKKYENQWIRIRREYVKWIRYGENVMTLWELEHEKGGYVE